MKNNIFVLFFALFWTIGVTAQEEVKVDQTYRAEVIQTLSDLLIENYVYEDVARKTAAHLQDQLAKGQFDALDELPAFAEALTKEVQSVNKDKHMRIRPSRPRRAPANTPERMVETHLERIQYRREVVAGFAEARKIEGNIGYLDLRGFAGLWWGRPVADHYMALLGTSDAMIVDLRKNGGGDPSMVQYLCSYFFEGKVHLNSLYWRQGDRTEEFWTLESVGGTKMPDVPLFVLTSSRTFSGAEEFSYNMQTQQRATLVGATTGGGANPGGGFSINPQLTVFIPTGAAVNPITGTNWEGVGVVPDVKVPVEEALDKAIELAGEAAEAYRKKTKERNQKLLTELQSNLAKLDKESSADSVIEQIKACQQAGLFTEGDINTIGYQYLNGIKNPYAAEAMFKSNTMLYPASANTYDSYAEALAANGKLSKAIKYYQKAVAVAEESGDGNVDQFRQNLNAMKEKAAKSRDE